MRKYQSKIFIQLIIFLIIHNLLNAQNIFTNYQDFQNNTLIKYPEDKYIFTHQKIYFKNDKKKNKRDEYEKEQVLKLKNILKKELAEKINSKISSDIQINTNEVIVNKGNTFLQNTTSMQKLSSRIDLIDNEFQFGRDSSDIYIFGMIAVSKYKMWKYYESQVKNEIYNLELLVNTNSNAKTNEQLTIIITNGKHLIDEIKEDINILSIINNEYDSKGFYNSINLCERKLENIALQTNDKIFATELQIAEFNIESGNCYEAIKNLEKLIVKNSNFEKAILSRKKAKLCVENKLVGNLTNSLAYEDYKLSILQIDSLCLLDKKYEQLYAKTRKSCYINYIEKEILKIKNSIKIKDLNGAEQILEQLDLKEGTAFTNQISKLKLNISNLKYENFSSTFKNDLHSKNFDIAYTNLIKFSRSDAQSAFTKKLVIAEKTVTKKMYALTKTSMLIKKPTLYSLQLGFYLASFIQNASSFDPTGNFNILIPNNFYSYSPEYTFGLYRRINLMPRKRLLKKDIYKFNSNLIGLRLGIIDNHSRLFSNNRIYSDSNSKVSDLITLQLSMHLFKIFNLNYGIIKSEFDLKFDYYLHRLGFGIKIPIGPLNLNLNMNYMSNYEAIHLMNLESGLVLNFNFLKNFKKNDKNTAMNIINTRKLELQKQ